MLVLDSVCLLEVNYNYELEQVKSLQSFNNKSPNGIFQIYLLMGMEQNIQTRLLKSIHIPNRKSSNDILQSTDRKIELLQVGSQSGLEFKPLSLLVVNPKLNRDQTLLQQLRETYQTPLKFEYEPCIIDDNLCSDKELKLKCFQWNNKWLQTDFNIKDEFIELTVTPSDVNYNGDHPSTIHNQQEERANIPHPINYESFNEESMKQEELMKRIMKRIDNMMEYLNATPTPNDEILIKISLLIKKLKKSSTNDVDTELMSIENEIKLLQIICNQWEIIN
ncbi:hypothetical protein C6P44_004141 [Monosporozyma unispora]|nr:hypothetical protein C6P44_004141 [Kazachstania unispora]